MDIYQAKNIVQGSPNKVIVYKKNYNTRDIIELIKKALPLSVEQTEALAVRFKRPTLEQTCKAIFDFLKTIRYKVDANGTQVVPLPSKILADNRTDCKGLSIITHGILSNLGIEHAIRFAKYTNSDTPNEYTHVYCVVPTGGTNYITIDAVADSYNSEFGNINGKPLDLIFKKQMRSKYHPISKVSGIGFNFLGIKVNNPIDWVKEQYNDSNLKDKLSQFQDYVKETASKLEDAAKRVIQPLKTAVGAPVRAAYLGLINLNFKGWASMFNYGRMTEEEQMLKGLSPAFAATAKANYNAVRNAWYDWGGNRTQFDNAVKVGATRRPKLDTRGNASISGIGEAVTVAAILGTALPIIAALTPLVLAFKKTPELPPDIPLDDLKLDEDGNPIITEPSDNTMLYVGGAVVLGGLIYLMTKKK